MIYRKNLKMLKKNIESKINIHQLLNRINNAIANFDNSEIIWFRGHTASHKLLPTLYRFKGGIKEELSFISQYNDSKFNLSKEIIEIMIDMHHSYIPTRLLAWTVQLYIALFCALVRESDDAAIFILDPLALNKISKKTKKRELNSTYRAEDAFIKNWPNESSLPETPIAVDGNSFKEDFKFTIHGKIKLPLEDQVPCCVKKIVLTEAEKSFGIEILLSGFYAL